MLFGMERILLDRLCLARRESAINKAPRSKSLGETTLPSHHCRRHGARPASADLKDACSRLVTEPNVWLGVTAFRLVAGDSACGLWLTGQGIFPGPPQPRRHAFQFRNPPPGRLHPLVYGEKTIRYPTLSGQWWSFSGL